MREQRHKNEYVNALKSKIAEWGKISDVEQMREGVKQAVDYSA